MNFVGIFNNRNNITIELEDQSCILLPDESNNTSLKCTSSLKAKSVLSFKKRISVKDHYGYQKTSHLKFRYTERWSQSESWGGETPPRFMEGVHIPKGQSLLLDINPP